MTPELFKGLQRARVEVETLIKDDVASGRTPKDTAITILRKNDSDFIKWVLAETVKGADWDGRYSQATRDWAKHLYIPALHGEDANYARINTHPAHINQVVEAIVRA